MKQLLLTWTIVGLLASCDDSAQTRVRISVMEDRTETDFLIEPNREAIASLFGLEENMWQSVNFRYGIFSSLEHTRRFECTLPSASSIMGNDIERRAHKEDFLQTVSDILDHPKDSVVHRSSAIWEPLVEELRVLTSDTTARSYLLVFSDIAENSRFFSVHRASDMAWLANDPEAVRDLFLSKVSRLLPSSTKVKVIVAYQPRTLAEDQRFKLLRGHYERIFSELGIPIVFTTNPKYEGL